MRRSPPEFWERPGPLPRLLAPLGWAYGAAGRLRRAAATPWRAPVRVLCVGNLVAGGAGKTPVAIDLARRLIARGERPHLLSRGYGGRLAGPIQADPARHGYREVGDEALLLARVAPTWIARDRAAGAKAAVAAGATALVLDDGFQNPSLVQDLKFLVVDGLYGLGNGYVMPAGPLREPAASGLARADAVVVMGAGESGFAVPPGGPPVLHAHLVLRAGAAALRGTRVVAFAGIGRPQKFFEFLDRCGASVVARHAFADHHPYTAAALEPILAEAARREAQVLTTEKDWVRIPAELRDRITPVPVAVRWDDTARLDALLDKHISPQVAHGEPTSAG
jgi:tetraacyldisaccharide 4'-kinase